MRSSGTPARAAAWPTYRVRRDPGAVKPEAFGVGPGHVSEDASQGVGVGLFDAAKGCADLRAAVDRFGGDVAPVRARGDGEAVVVGFDLVVEGVPVVCCG